MNCQQVQSALGAFLSSNLSGADSRTIRNHLARCPACASSLGHLDLVEILPALEQTVEPSKDLEMRFRERLRRHREALVSRPGLRRWGMAWSRPWRLSAVGAMAALLLVVFYFAGIGREVPERAAVSEYGAAENLPLLKEMAVINNLDLLEDLDLIENLDAAPPLQPNRN